MPLAMPLGCLEVSGVDLVRPIPALASNGFSFLTSTDPISSEVGHRVMGFSSPNARPGQDHRATRKVGRCLRPAVTAPNRSRKACASLRCTTSRIAPPMPQARPAPARDPRPPGKPPPPLPRSASQRATPTRPRHPGAYEIARTHPRGERTKAPAQAGARAPPGPPRLPRPTAGSYPPLPRPPPALAIRGFLLSSRVPIFTISVDFLLRSPDGSLYNHRAGKAQAYAHHCTCKPP
jgi:hypothetical protein